VGFLKEVTKIPSTFLAFQYDGTQQSLDDLETALGPNPVTGIPLNLTRISSSLYQMTWVGTNQYDTDDVRVWEIRPDGVFESPGHYPDGGATYDVFWADV